VAQLGRGAPHQRRLASDLHFLGHLTDLERDVEPGGLRDLHHHAAAQVLLEADCSTVAT
jgi:hypothetical protein